MSFWNGHCRVWFKIVKKQISFNDLSKSSLSGWDSSDVKAKVVTLLNIAMWKTFDTVKGVNDFSKAYRKQRNSDFCLNEVVTKSLISFSAACESSDFTRV